MNYSTKIRDISKIAQITIIEKVHTFTICIKSIKRIEKDIITLIVEVDFLKHVRFRTSKIILIKDEEIKFQKEILSEGLDISSFFQRESLSLKRSIFFNFQKF